MRILKRSLLGLGGLLLSLVLAAQLSLLPSQAQIPALQTGLQTNQTDTSRTGTGRTYYVAPNGSDAGDGSLAKPWATPQQAAAQAQAGDTVYLRAGTYALTEPLRLANSGTESAWITWSAYPRARVVLDAQAVQVSPPSGKPPFSQDQGAVQIENLAYIKLQRLEVINSHNAGITVRNSHHIRLSNNTTQQTFSSGIGVWNSQDIKVLGNTVINANNLKLEGFPYKDSEAPHEAISLGGAQRFEVAYNHVHHGHKEGIDIKESSQRGRVHHNYIHDMPRQGLYIDSWGSLLESVEMDSNVVHDCRGAGFALSAEGEGAIARDISLHHNLIYNNWGTGILFSTWGNDGPRENIKIYNNTVHHNGFGKPNPGEQYHWITGGLYLFSDRLQDVEIHHNSFSDNTGFQIGYRDRYLQPNAKSKKSDPKPPLDSPQAIAAIFSQKGISIRQNRIAGPNSATTPIYAGWGPDNYANIYGFDGARQYGALWPPDYQDPSSGNFYARATLHEANYGALSAADAKSDRAFWWKNNFPPSLN